jgi:hypothetical protein
MQCFLVYWLNVELEHGTKGLGGLFWWNQSYAVSRYSLFNIIPLVNLTIEYLSTPYYIGDQEWTQVPNLSHMVHF